jgi:hypothetical protein
MPSGRIGDTLDMDATMSIGILDYWRWQVAWAAVFTLNLIVPLYFGLDVTSSGG